MQKTNTQFSPSTRTDRVGGDGVGVLGAGGRGDHASSTSASRAATQLDLLGGQQQYDRLRCSGTRDLASVPPPKPSRTSKMASSRPKLYPCRAELLVPVALAKQPATSRAQFATTTWAFSPTRPSDLLSSRAPAASSAPTPSAHATAAAVRSPASQTNYEKMAWRLCGSACKKLQSDAKMAALTCCPRERRYLGVNDSSPGLEAIIIAGRDRDLSL